MTGNQSGQPLLESELGFGFIEVMVVVLLIAVLATIAVPSFRNLVDETRVNSEASTLTTAFNRARDYAIRHNTQARLCAGQSCSSGGTLAKGWVIQNQANKIVDAWSAPTATTQSFFNGSSLQSVTYNKNGLPVNRPNGYIDICSGRQKRQIVFNAVGNLQTRNKNGSCASCSCHP